MNKIIEKPWGSEEILEANSRYILKRLNINKGHRLSKQYHKYKHETLYLIKGKANVQLGARQPEFGNSIVIPEPFTFSINDYIVIEPNMIHRIEALEDCIFLEASTPELWDVERLEDDYNRIE